MNPIFSERITAMAAYNIGRVMNTAKVRGVDTMYWYSSGLYCRTQISG